MPLLSLGLAMIASALIVGQVEENRELAWQKNKLQMDLDYLEKQASVNEEFLTKLKQGEDAGLVERLAQRQKNLVRKGSAILDLKGPAGEDNTSAFKLTRLPPPPEIRPYEPARGFFTRFLGSAHQRVMAYGIGGFLVALGLISGGSEERKSA